MTNTDEARRAVRETIEQLDGIDIVLSNAVRTCPRQLGEDCALDANKARAGPSSATGRITRG